MLLIRNKRNTIPGGLVRFTDLWRKEDNSIEKLFYLHEPHIKRRVEIPTCLTVE